MGVKNIDHDKFRNETIDHAQAVLMTYFRVKKVSLPMAAYASLLNYAGLAVNIKMSKKQFLAVAAECYDDARYAHKERKRLEKTNTK